MCENLDRKSRKGVRLQASTGRLRLTSPGEGRNGQESSSVIQSPRSRRQIVISSGFVIVVPTQINGGQSLTVSSDKLNEGRARDAIGTPGSRSGGFDAWRPMAGLDGPDRDRDEGKAMAGKQWV